MDENFRLKLALEEARNTYDIHSHTSDILDRKAAGLLSSASLIVGLFSLLELNSMFSSENKIFIFLFLIILGLYFFLLLNIILAINPRDYRTPIGTAEFDEILIEQPPTMALESIKIGYIASAEKYKENNQKKSNRVRAASWLLFAIAALVFILLLSPQLT